MSPFTRSFAIVMTIIIAGCASQENPFFTEWNTPHGTPPFDRIELAHYAPAFERGMQEQVAEVDAIIGSAEEPTFANTVEAFEHSGALLSQVARTFFPMLSSMSNKEMQALAKDISPKLSRHSDAFLLNDKLFQRVKQVYETMDEASLTEEQKQLTTKLYKRFVRGGADLDPESKGKLEKLNEELSVLTLTFGDHVLEETNAFEMVVDNESDLAGLPQSSIDAAAEAAGERGHEGKWVFTTHKPSMIPFLTYADNRDLREKLYMGYINRGNNGDSLDNKATLLKIANLRSERAKLLGYPTHAHYVLEENMAKEPSKVYELLNRLWRPALKRAKAERADMQKMIDAEGGKFKVASWDWWYYAEKIRKEKYDLDEEMLRPYFELGKVRQGVFDVASKLYGLQFRPLANVTIYHPDVEVFEVLDADSSQVGILYVDYFPRESKRGGAWMGEFREQHRMGDADIRPVVYNVGNFTKPTADAPSLLSLDEAATLFHEFGHALHSLLSECTYETLAGTNVQRDFVELPSQIMENWAFEPEVLRTYARHYQTNEPIPDELIRKIRQSSTFNQGFATTEYLAASFLDLAWHTLEAPIGEDVMSFEDRVLKDLGLIPEIISRYRSPYFNHIFSGGYAAGYYSYVWAEVLDADAFQAFKETGNIFDKKTADAFRKNILSAGATEDGMTLYKRFRGKEPSIEPLLMKRGLK